MAQPHRRAAHLANPAACAYSLRKERVNYLIGWNPDPVEIREKVAGVLAPQMVGHRPAPFVHLYTHPDVHIRRQVPDIVLVELVRLDQLDSEPGWAMFVTGYLANDAVSVTEARSHDKLIRLDP